MRFFVCLIFYEMKSILKISLVAAIGLFISSCDKDKGILPEIELKSGVDYISADSTIQQGTDFTIGITAKKTETRDVLKKFNISKSVNGGSNSTVYTRDLNDSEEDYFSYNYNGTASEDSADVVLYTFTITNRDGLVNQATVELTID